MAIQIKNKYLKRLLKKTEVITKKTGGSSTIEKVIKGGGPCPDNIQTVLNNRAQELFTIALIKQVADAIPSESERGRRRHKRRGKIEGISTLAPKIKALVNLIPTDINDDKFITIADVARITIDDSTDQTTMDKPNIPIQYYNIDKNATDEDDIKTGIVKWTTDGNEKMFKGKFKMADDGEPTWIAGTFYEKGETQNSIFNGVVIDIPEGPVAAVRPAVIPAVIPADIQESKSVVIPEQCKQESDIQVNKTVVKTDNQSSIMSRLLPDGIQSNVDITPSPEQQVYYYPPINPTGQRMNLTEEEDADFLSNILETLQEKEDADLEREAAELAAAQARLKSKFLTTDLTRRVQKLAPLGPGGSKLFNKRPLPSILDTSAQAAQQRLVEAQAQAQAQAREIVNPVEPEKVKNNLHHSITPGFTPSLLDYSPASVFPEAVDPNSGSLAPDLTKSIQSELQKPDAGPIVQDITSVGSDLPKTFTDSVTGELSNPVSVKGSEKAVDGNSTLSDDIIRGLTTALSVPSETVPDLSIHPSNDSSDNTVSEPSDLNKMIADSITTALNPGAVVKPEKVLSTVTENSVALSESISGAVVNTLQPGVPLLKKQELRSTLGLPSISTAPEALQKAVAESIVSSLSSSGTPAVAPEALQKAVAESIVSSLSSSGTLAVAAPAVAAPEALQKAVAESIVSSLSSSGAVVKPGVSETGLTNKVENSTELSKDTSGAIVSGLNSQQRMQELGVAVPVPIQEPEALQKAVDESIVSSLSSSDTLAPVSAPEPVSALKPVSVVPQEELQKTVTDSLTSSLSASGVTLPVAPAAPVVASEELQKTVTDSLTSSLSASAVTIPVAPVTPLVASEELQKTITKSLISSLVASSSAPSAAVVQSPVVPVVQSPVVPDFTSGFLLVCPSSMKVVSIFNHSTEKQIFAYDNNMSNSKLPSFTEGTIDMFIEQINKFIDQPNSCKESTTDINKDTLTTLFANGFMNGLLSKGSNTNKDTLTTLFANGFMNGLLSKGSNTDIDMDIKTNKDTLTTLFANGFMNGLLSKGSNTDIDMDKDKGILTTLFADGFIRALQPVV
jgi:hypothetical protein